MRDEKLYWFSGQHIAYEIEMCARAAHLVLAFAPERHSVTNALLESYALHLRNLIEFIYRKPRLDDVNAIHYVCDREAWIAARGEVPAYLKVVKDRADKQVAHLTKKRFSGDAPEKQWSPVEEIGALMPSLQVFMERARPELLHANVANALAELAALVQPRTKEN